MLVIFLCLGSVAVGFSLGVLWASVANERAEKVLDEFDGTINRVADGIAHVTLCEVNGGNVTFYGEYPADDLEALGIRDRFCCKTILQRNGAVQIQMTPKD